MAPCFDLKQGKRYRLRMRNASDDIHPIHLHRHTFELTQVAGQPTSGCMKDVVMVGGYQEARDRFRRGQSWADAFPLSSAVAHGFWLHGAVRLCVIVAQRQVAHS